MKLMHKNEQEIYKETSLTFLSESIFKSHHIKIACAVPLAIGCTRNNAFSLYNKGFSLDQLNLKIYIYIDIDKTDKIN